MSHLNAKGNRVDLMANERFFLPFFSLLINVNIIVELIVDFVEQCYIVHLGPISNYIIAHFLNWLDLDNFDWKNHKLIYNQND